MTQSTVQQIEAQSEKWKHWIGTTIQDEDDIDSDVDFMVYANHEVSEETANQILDCLQNCLPAQIAQRDFFAPGFFVSTCLRAFVAEEKVMRSYWEIRDRKADESHMPLMAFEVLWDAENDSFEESYPPGFEEVVEIQRKLFGINCIAFSENGNITVDMGFGNFGNMTEDDDFVHEDNLDFFPEQETEVHSIFPESESTHLH